MYQNPKKTIRKPSDNKHRLFEILSQIKESISKRRFNHAYEMGSKYYEQNKTILTNEQIYQLSLNCCKAIQNKLYHRLTIKKKKYVPPVTKSLIQHLFSLQMSLHSVLLPQLVKLDEKHFNMLSVQNQGINPKDISIQEITFQRKSNDFFLDNSKVTKQVKRLIKKHLKVCNTVLMYKLKYPKNKNQIKEIFQIMEDIYQHFEEHDFPSQHMDYVLIKLSLIEVEGSNQDIPCTYKLPLGFLAKLYQKIRKNTQNGIQYYLNKLGSFLLLAFRHLPISIEDMFVLTNQIQYITKILNKQYEENSNTGTIFKKKQGLNYKRQVTIDNQPYEVSVLRLSKRVESTSTQSKLSQKKMESKRNIQNTYKSLRILAQTALQQIEYSMNSRRQVLQIVLKYFTMSYLQKSRANDSDQILSSEAVLLNTNSQNNKKNNFRENIQSGSSSQKKARTNFQSLTCLLQDIRIQKNSSSLEQVNEEQKMKFRKTMKQQGKFITRNVELVSRQSGLKIGYFNVVNNLLRSIESYERNLLSDDLTLDKDDVLQDFQLDRLEKIRSYKEKLKVKPNKFEKNMREHKQQILQIPNYKKKQSQKINLLNDVVQNNVIKLLQLPFNEFTSKNRSYSNPVFKKLEGLKLQTQNLNTQRKYLVQKLKARKILCLTQHNTQIYQNQTKLTQKQFKKQKENFDQISQFSQNLTQKMDKYIQNNKKLMKIEKDSKSTFITKVLNKPKIQLKLENQKTKKLPQITFQKLQKQYNKLQGKLQKDKIDWELTLSSQFDKLRRDAAKNQFSNQNQRRHKNQNIKMSNNTINQIVLDDQPQNFN